MSNWIDTSIAFVGEKERTDEHDDVVNDTGRVKVDCETTH